MNTNRDLNYRLYLQREEGFHRISFSSEFEKYKIISSGDVKKVRENIAGIKQNFYQGQGTLSKDPVKNVRYHLSHSSSVTQTDNTYNIYTQASNAQDAREIAEELARIKDQEDAAKGG
mgnify:CR=1 FL=1